MKKIVYILTLLMVVFSACEPNEEIYEQLDELKEPYHNTVDYTLTSNDYETITELALEEAKNENDSTWAEYIAEFEAFNDKYPGSEYVPHLLADLFPAYNKGSAANVTFNYIADIPDELGIYSNASFYKLKSSDYENISSLVSEVGYFYSDYSPDLFIPEVLSSSITNVSEGDIYRVNYLFSDEKPVIPESPAVETYSEDFTSDLSGVETFSITGDAQVWEWDEYGGESYAKMSGFDYPNAIQNEDWLITPNISINEGVNTTLNITQAINYLNGETQLIDILISTDYNGDVTTATWTSIKAEINMPAGNGWTFVESGDVNLNAYEGQSINIGFKYTSNTNDAPTWEISEIKVLEGEKIIEGEPYELNDYYQYDNGTWNKMTDVYYLNPQDYDAMGAPGEYNNFSSDASPRDYLPGLLEAMYPSAGEGVSKIVVFKYYTGIEGTLTLADKYTYTNGAWESLYNYVEETERQFVHKDGNWVFDPTVQFTVSGSDYQMIVDYVETNISADYIDSYGTGEYYYGANSYHSNFDKRISQRLAYEPETFENLSEEKSLELIDERVQKGIVLLLQLKYPEAVPQTNGIDVHYIVTYQTYNNDYSRSYPTVDYLCTEAASGSNPPQFELVEGPYEEE